MTRVLIADDSSFMRASLTHLLQSDKDLEVVATATDGADAVRKVQQLRPDVVLLDLEMAGMDGLAALGHIMADYPTPVLVLSGLNKTDPDVAVRCLERGAVDFIPKPSGVISYDIDRSRVEIIAKVKQAAGLRLPRKPLGPGGSRPRVVVIGASTGGPRAVGVVLAGLPHPLEAALLVVQHMSPAFMPSFAGRLRWQCLRDVDLAREQEHLTAGRVLLAPGGCHTLIGQAGEARRVRFSSKTSPHGLFPSIDYAMESAAETYGPGAVGILLTGIGSDGARGMKAIKDAGGATIAEDPSTCVAFGMPQAAIDLGCVDRIVPLPQVARALLQVL